MRVNLASLRNDLDDLSYLQKYLLSAAFDKLQRGPISTVEAEVEGENRQQLAV